MENKDAPMMTKKEWTICVSPLFVFVYDCCFSRRILLWYANLTGFKYHKYGSSDFQQNAQKTNHFLTKISQSETQNFVKFIRSTHVLLPEKVLVIFYEDGPFLHI